MPIYSRLKIFVNLLRVLLVLLLIDFLYIFIAVVMERSFDYFSIFLLAVCLMLLSFILRALWSIRTVYKHITITEQGIKIKNITGIGTAQFFLWQEMTAYKLEYLTSMRGPNYHKLSLTKNKKNILSIDSLTYANFNKMRDAIQHKMDAINY